MGHTIKFPKSQRFVMAKRIEDAVLNFYDLLLLAVKEEKDKKGGKREKVDASVQTGLVHAKHSDT